MNILVYGFGPYKQHKENITEKIIRKIRKNVIKVVFPVKPEKSCFWRRLRDINQML